MKRLLSIGLWRPWRAALCAACLGASVTYAADSAQVTITQVDSLGNSLADAAYGSTEASFTSVTAPSRSGYYFTHWSLEPADTPNFVNRDVLGRALDRVSVVPKGDTTLVANYQAVSVDTDEDGVADGREIYWYGDLDEIATSDTDGDGYTFAQEMQYDMNPLLPDGFELGGIIYGDSSIFWYNPKNYTPYTIQKNLDGVITVVDTGYLAKGASKTTPSYSASQGFAYWTINGAPQADVLGRALDTVTFVGIGETNGDEIVAEAILLSDADARALAYWYGVGTDKTMESDTDGDGYTLAQEVQYNMNPHLPDGYDLGGVIYGDSSTFWYNPNSYSSYKIQTNRDGTITVVESGFLKKNETKTTTSYASNSTFAYWDINSVRQADVLGRALDQVTLVGTGAADAEQVATANFVTSNSTDRALAYWYNPDSGVTADSDTDGDGYTLAQEIQFGMNPHLPDGYDLGGIVYGDGPTLETNLQPFDMGSRAIVDGNVVDFFATLDGMTGNLTGGLDFNGAMVTPAIVDADSDGNFDLVVATPTAITLYKNIGAAGAPNFTAVENVYSLLLAQMATMVRPTLVGGTVTIEDATHPALWLADQGGAVFCYDITADTLTKTGTTGFPVWETTFGTFADGMLTLADATTLSCDATPAGVTSVAYADANQDDVNDLLVADEQGRISLYTQANGAFTLRHRVWGGSYIGFANGLALAPVDWDNDGDLDAVCGTSDGHLLLLSDPGIGRPTNLSATAGYDNVLLQWDPNKQSRVSGYGVYRAAGSAATDFASIADVKLPTHRDKPPSIAEWAYRVTAKSRLWKAGNSTPEVFESAPSEAISVNLGQVSFALPDAAGFYGQTVDAVISIDNSKGLAAAGLSLTVTYDAALLTPAGYQLSGLSEELTLSDTAVVDPETNLGTRTITATAGTLAAGSGELVRLTFTIAEGSEKKTTPVKLISATVKSIADQTVKTVLPKTEATISLDKQVEPIVVELSAKNVVATKWPVTISVTVLVDDSAFDWSSLELKPDYDESLLTLTASTVPTAGNSTATFTFDKVDGAEDPEEGYVEIAVSGTATNAEMDPVTCTVLLPSDGETGEGEGGGNYQPGGRWWKPIVVLTVDHSEHDRLIEQTAEGAIEITLNVWARGWFDWNTLEVTPTFNTSQLTLVKASSPKWVNYWQRTITYTFKVLEAEERHLWLTFDGSGYSRISKTTPAIVFGTQTRLHIADRPHPGVVQPGLQGDCDGDGRLTANDYQVAFRTVQEFHPSKGYTKPHTPEAQRVHNAICMAIGKPTEDNLTLADVTNSYKKWLWDRGVTDTNMGNDKDKDKDKNPGGGK